jgi:hypothetical protein
MKLYTVIGRAQRKTAFIEYGRPIIRRRLPVVLCANGVSQDQRSSSH